MLAGARQETDKPVSVGSTQDTVRLSRMQPRIQPCGPSALLKAWQLPVPFGMMDCPGEARCR
jgi:hypothetical protein